MGKDSAAGPETELDAERERLGRARQALRGMRDEARDTAVALGDPVVDKAINAYLTAAKQRRMATFTEADETAPPFFGRLDLSPDAPVIPGGRIYLGRRLVREAAGDDPLVVDWRSPVARPFYRARPGAPLGVHRRRRFGFDGRALTAYEDEVIGDGDPGPAAGTDGALLDAEISRPRSGPMRDIVATIQPEQDEIVRADLGLSVCVQGAPGTGKTAVGLHRAAYLLYTYRERLRRTGVLVIGPSRAFLAYIAAVLPTLGELTVVERDIGTLVDGVTVVRDDPPELATLKGDGRMATVIARVLTGVVREPRAPVTVTTTVGRWTVGPDELAELLAAVRAGPARYGTGRDMLARRVAGVVRQRAEQSGRHFTDGAVESMARGRAIRDALADVWPKIDATELVHRLLTDPELLADAADGVLTGAEQRLLTSGGGSRPAAGARRWSGRPARGGRWTVADTYLVDEARDQIDAMVSFGHVIVDEAQDLSALQCRAVGRRAADGSLTVLGDLAQGSTPWAAQSWDPVLAHLGTPGAHRELLTRSHRVPAEILAFAGRLLPVIAPDVPAAYSDRSVPDQPRLVRTDPAGLLAAAARAVRRARAEPGSMAVIAPDELVPALRTALATDAGQPPLVELTGDASPGRANLVPASRVKGLEFDHVVVTEPAAVVAAAPTRTLGLRTLYVALTRAVTSLTVLHAAPLPAELAGIPGLGRLASQPAEPRPAVVTPSAASSASGTSPG